MRLSGPALALVARAAEGGMRDALSLLDRVRAACGDEPGDDAVAEALGVVDAAAVSRIATALVRRDAAALLAEVAALYERGLEMRRVAEELVRFLRDATVARLAPGVPLDLPEAELKDVQALAAEADPAQVARLFDIAQRAVLEVKLADQPRYALEVALLKGAVLAPGADVAELLARAEALASGRPVAARAGQPPPPAPAAPRAAPAPAKAPVPVAAPPVAREASPTVTTSAPAAAADAPAAAEWRVAVAAVEAESPTLGSALKQATLVALGSPEVRIRFAAGTRFPDMVERKRAAVEKAFSSHLGRPVKLAIEVGPAPAAAETAAPVASIASVERAEREARVARVRDEARTHPNIQEAAKLLGADIEGTDEL
jgi:DNA polymerase-3 subunit gamma/tau